MVQSDANPGGLPKSVFDDRQAQLAANRSVFYRALVSGPFYGFNWPGVESSAAIIENWWRQGMMGGAKAHYDGIVAFSQTDFTEDLKRITVPALVMHGDDDQIVPYAGQQRRTSLHMLPGCRAVHLQTGICSALADRERGMGDPAGLWSEPTVRADEGVAMKLATLARMGAAASAGLLGVMVAVPAAASEASGGASVPCSVPALVAAINAANGPGGGTINLASGCTYTLSAVNNSLPMIGPNGLPAVISNIAINGDGATIARSSAPGTPAFRILAVLGTLSVQDLTITGGLAPVGGGLASKGTVTLNHTQVTGNTVTGAEGPASPGGAGIFNSGGTLTLNNSQVNDNSASGANGGGIVNANGTVVLNSSQVDGNQAGNGGGIASGNQNGSVGGGGSLTLNKSQVDNNTATFPPGFGAAGGIANGGIAVLNSSEVDGNVITSPGGAGGGIANHGAMTISKSSVDGNTATTGPTGGGGGIANFNAGVGNGGILVPGTGVLTINNSDVSGNSTDGTGGGIFNLESTFTVQLTVNHSQLDSNSATSGGGAIFTDNPATITLATTSFNGNTPDNCEPTGLIHGCLG